MKKSIIAGAGVMALAAAAMPFAGVFAAADASVTDALTVTISKSCTLTREGAAATGGDAAYNAGTYTRTMIANELQDLGTSTFTVNCNATDGYDVVATFGALTSGSDSITYKNSAAAIGDGKWSALITGGADSYVASGATVKTASGETPAAGDTFTVKYSVGTTNNQAAGVYTNNAAAVYELTAKASS